MEEKQKPVTEEAVTQETVAEKTATQNTEGQCVEMLNLGKFKAGAIMDSKDFNNAELFKDVEIEFGFNPKDLSPLIVCPKSSSAQNFTWEFLIGLAIKNGLLDNLIKEKFPLEDKGVE